MASPRPGVPLDPVAPPSPAPPLTAPHRPGPAGGPAGRSIAGRWVALAVIAMVAACTAFFAVVAAGHRSRGVSVPTGSHLGAAPAAPLLAPVTTRGLPPPDVVTNLVVPSGTTLASSSAADTPEGMYDRSVRLAVPNPVDAVTAFFQSRLAALGWRMTAVVATPDGRGRQLIGSRLSHDSYGWTVGVAVEPLGTGAGGAGRSRVVVRIIQQSDST